MARNSGTYWRKSILLLGCKTEQVASADKLREATVAVKPDSKALTTVLAFEVTNCDFKLPNK
jgi:hypothetical protein